MTDRRARYDAKNGLTTKSYKLKKEIAEEFKETCYRVGISQAQALTEFMLGFIENNKSDYCDQNKNNGYSL